MEQTSEEQNVPNFASLSLSLSIIQLVPNPTGSGSRRAHTAAVKSPCHRFRLALEPARPAMTSHGALIPVPTLGHGVRLHVSVVVLAGPDEAAVGLHALGHHVVDEPVLVPDPLGLKLGAVLSENQPSSRFSRCV